MARDYKANFNGKEHKLTKEDKVKGGINSGKSRNDAKNSQEMAQIALHTILSADKVSNVNEIANILGEDENNWSVLQLGMFQLAVKAAQGDTQALLTLIELAGEKPANKQTLTVNELPTTIFVGKTGCKEK